MLMTANEAERAQPAADERLVLHRDLQGLNRARLQPLLADPAWRDGLDAERALREREEDFLADERAAVATWAARAPTDPDAFVAWFTALRALGPGQGDPLFAWLARDADRARMRWFIAQEIAGEAGFDDLLALTQLKLPGRAKLEVARNYWDEMGRGRAPGMHGPLLDRLARALALPDPAIAVAWEPLALANLMAGLAANRRYAWQAIGALGAVELTSPTRVGHVATGLRRLGLGADAAMYYSLHATVDVAHAESWLAEVIQPLVAEDPRRAAPIAEGALMRLEAGRRCFVRYRARFGLG